MNATKKNFSVLLYRYLCDVIGTEDVVRKRRQIFTALETTSKEPGLICISSGSKAEGLNLEGSDFDEMKILSLFQVDENMKNEYIGRKDKAYVFMDTEECHAGFTKLKVCNSSASKGLTNVGLKLMDNYLPSESFLTWISQYETCMLKHGPCFTNENGSYDLAFTLWCKKWISQANSWLLRSTYSWASSTVTGAIVQFGVLFVPIGSKNSPNVDLEWRISFSHAEKQLIWSFNHIQLLCYALLKVVLTDIIKKRHGDVLCSYFLKTIMFWMCEETESKDWIPANMLSCFICCLKRLLYCVEHKTCIHYFIPSNDLFENRFNEEEKNKLLSTIKSVIESGWACLEQTQLYKSGNPFSPSFIGISTTSYLHSLYHIPVKTLLPTCSAKYNIFLCLRLPSAQKDFFIYIVSYHNQLLANQGLLDTFKINDNKHQYRVYKERLHHLLIGVNHDAFSGWLLLASFFFFKKQYQICKDIVQWCLWKNGTIEQLLLRHSRGSPERTFHYIQKQTGIHTITACKMLLRNDLEFQKQSPLIPVEVLGTLKFFSLFFAQYLHFLCNHYLNDKRNAKSSLRDLDITEKVYKHRVTNSHHCMEIAETLYSTMYKTK